MAQGASVPMALGTPGWQVTRVYLPRCREEGTSCLRPAMGHGGELDGPGRSATATDSPSVASIMAWVAPAPGELAEDLAVGGHRPKGRGTPDPPLPAHSPDGLELARAALARAYRATARPAWLRPQGEQS
jgi:hypothetical protein